MGKGTRWWPGVLSGTCRRRITTEQASELELLAFGLLHRERGKARGLRFGFGQAGREAEQQFYLYVSRQIIVTAQGALSYE